MNLSEKKKIKDLFLVVFNSIDPKENRRLLSSLIQFASNLCYGTGKFRTMLRSDSPANFLGTLKSIFQTTAEDESDKQRNTDRIVLR